MPKSLELVVNGKKHSTAGDPQDRLLWILRDELALTGTKYGCGEGSCGACTVLLDGKPVRSCITLAGQCEGKSITTVEALEQDGRLHPLQQAFLEVESLQCGYCTSGMLMSGMALLAEKHSPSRDDIVRAMNGNICRCCTYSRIVQAIELAAAKGGV